MNDRQMDKLLELTEQNGKMLKAILVGRGHYHVAGGYCWGNTSEGASFLILYPASPVHKFQICRVYADSSGFREIPDAIKATREDTGFDKPGDKEWAKKKGVFHECAMMGVITHDGKDTQMGKEKRFSSVLWVSGRNEAPPIVPEPVDVSKLITLAKQVYGVDEYDSNLRRIVDAVTKGRTESYETGELTSQEVNTLISGLTKKSSEKEQAQSKKPSSASQEWDALPSVPKGGKSSDGTKRPDWKNPKEAQAWAVKIGACENEHEARNSMKKIVDAQFGGKFTTLNKEAVFDAYWERQQEKLAKKAQPEEPAAEEPPF